MPPPTPTRLPGNRGLPTPSASVERTPTASGSVGAGPFTPQGPTAASEYLRALSASSELTELSDLKDELDGVKNGSLSASIAAKKLRLRNQGDAVKQHRHSFNGQPASSSSSSLKPEAGLSSLKISRKRGRESTEVKSGRGGKRVKGVFSGKLKRSASMNNVVKIEGAPLKFMTPYVKAGKGWPEVKERDVSIPSLVGILLPPLSEVSTLLNPFHRVLGLCQHISCNQ